MAGEEGLERKHDSVREFFTNHIKTIVTLVMIFGTILCIVLIVMVHKWQYDSEKAAEIAACLDVAVIGAGLSGSYASWRMRHDSLSKIHLFEVSDRIGGRLYTHHTLYEGQGQTLKAEMGALYYLPQRHQLLNRTIHALKLTPKESSPQNQDQKPSTYYFRDQHRTTKDIKFHRSHSPPLYNLPYTERDRTPEELKRFYSETHLEHIHTDPLSVTYNHANLYEMGYWNFINSVSSREGFNLIQDGARWKSHVSNGNAALLASLDLDTFDPQYTLEEGMDALPKAMVKQFENSSNRHEVHYNRRLACVHKEDKHYYILVFQKTVTKNGITTNITESEHVCARRIILAIPPSRLKAIKFTGFEEDIPPPSSLVDQYLDPIPAMTAYFLFSDPWWVGLRPTYEDIITDLPLRRMRFFGTGRKVSYATNSSDKSFSYGHLFMVASPDLDDVTYFDPLIQAAQYGSVVMTDGNLTMQNLNDLKSQLAKLQGLTDASGIPNPSETFVQDWRAEPFGAGWHMWKTGVNWKKASRCLSRPFHEENIFLIGSDICSGTCQFWAEGALQTVEELFQRYNTSKIFQKAMMAPIENEEIQLEPSNSSTYQNV